MQMVCRTLRTLQISTSAQNSRKETKPVPPSQIEVNQLGRPKISGSETPGSVAIRWEPF